MPANSAEYQRRYRSLRKNERKEEISMLLKMQEEIENLRKEVAFLTEEIRKRPSLKTLSSNSESMSLKKEVRERESEQARLARLAVWTPNDACRKRADEDSQDLDRQAEMYRCQQSNAKHKHKDFDKGFMKWLLNAPAFEGIANGQGRANGQHKPSAVDNLFLGAARAAEAVARRERARSPPAAPLLDSGRRPGDPASSD